MQDKAIFFVKDFTTGGLERVLVNVVNTLADNGWQIMIVWSGVVSNTFLQSQISADVKQIYTSDIWHLPKLRTKPVSTFMKIIKSVYTVINNMMVSYLTKFIPEFDSYRYVIDFRNGSSLVYKLKLKSEQKKIVWLHGSYDSFFKKNKFIKKHILEYDKIVCLTDAFKEHFTKQYPMYKDKIYRIYNPVKLGSLSIKDEENMICKKYMPYFLHISRIDKDKDILTMIRAYELFVKNSKSTTGLVFLGGGEMLEYYRSMAKNMGMEDRIIFYGNSDCVDMWMRFAQALILSSRSEGLPTVLIEGQMNKTLVISSDCSDGPAEILKKGQCGILYKVGDFETLADILADVDRSDFDKEKYICKASDELYRFSCEEFIDRFANL